jgi:formylglycine-generating enzyme required for sulfatase activity
MKVNTSESRTRTARVRGGSWNGGPRNARVAGRGWSTPDLRCDFLGLRLVRQT